MATIADLDRLTREIRRANSPTIPFAVGEYVEIAGESYVLAVLAEHHEGAKEDACKEIACDKEDVWKVHAYDFFKSTITEQLVPSANMKRAHCVATFLGERERLRSVAHKAKMAKVVRYNAFECCGVSHPLLKAVVQEPVYTVAAPIFSLARPLGMGLNLPFDEMFLDTDKTLCTARLGACTLGADGPMLLSMTFRTEGRDAEVDESSVLALGFKGASTFSEIAAYHLWSGNGDADCVVSLNKKLFAAGGALDGALGGVLPKTQHQQILTVSALHLAAFGITPGVGDSTLDAHCQHRAHYAQSAADWYNATTGLATFRPVFVHLDGSEDKPEPPKVYNGRARERKLKGDPELEVFAVRKHPSQLDVNERMLQHRTPAAVRKFDAYIDKAVTALSTT